MSTGTNANGQGQAARIFQYRDYAKENAAIKLREIAKIRRETGLGFEDADLLYCYRHSEDHLTHEKCRLAETLEHAVARAKAERALNSLNGGGPTLGRGNGHADSAYGRRQQTQEAEPADLGEWNVGEDDELWEHIPPRGWLLGNVFCRGFVSSLLGEGGAGKTALRMAQLISLAIGRSLTGEHVFQRCRVLLISLEDDARELRRRIRAACIHHNIARDDLNGWLFIVSLRARDGKLMMLDRFGRPERGNLGDKIRNAIIARNIDIVNLDPFVKSHSVAENDNSAIDAVVQILADIATDQDVAIDTPHHVAKGINEPGNANRGRGASAKKDADRLVYTLTVMSQEEAEAFGISEADRRLFIRMDSGKVNIARPLRQAKWFRLIGVPLGNKTELYPNGDEVQTVEPWTPPDTWAGLDTELLNRILTAIDGGLPDGNFFTDAAKASGREAWRVVCKFAPTRTETQAREIIRIWVKNGLLAPFEYDNPVTRKRVRGLQVDATKRPDLAHGSSKSRWRKTVDADVAPSL